MIVKPVGFDHQRGGIMSGSTTMCRGNTLRNINNFMKGGVEL